MLRITQPPATAAVTTEHPVATVGRYLVRYALVVVIAWIGALKYTGYEAVGIQPLIAHSPIISWMYTSSACAPSPRCSAAWRLSPRCSVAIRPWRRGCPVIGSVMGIGLFLATLSFLFTTPGSVTAASGFPVLSVMLASSCSRTSCW